MEIKSAKFTDASKLANVQRELAELGQIKNRSVPASTFCDEMRGALRQVNESLWDVEDALRICERDGDFGSKFVELARSVYKLNDRRAALKRKINDFVGSPIVEEKDYVSYD